MIKFPSTPTENQIHTHGSNLFIFTNGAWHPVRIAGSSGSGAGKNSVARITEVVEVTGDFILNPNSPGKLYVVGDEVIDDEVVFISLPIDDPIEINSVVYITRKTEKEVRITDYNSYATAYSIPKGQTVAVMKIDTNLWLVIGPKGHTIRCEPYSD